MTGRITGVPGTTPTVPTPGPMIVFQPPKAVITLPPNLGRPPKATDLIIKRCFDGKTPTAAVNLIKKQLTGRVHANNKALVEQTARDRVRDFNVALNNVFAPNSPNNAFLTGLNAKAITVLGTMSSLTPVVYQVQQGKFDPPKYYSRDWSGNFVEMQKPPTQVVMAAQIRLNPPGLAMTYPEWTNKALASPQLTTITEG